MKHKIGLIGFGTVGKGFAEILIRNKQFLKEKYNVEFEIIAISDIKYGTVYNSEGLDILSIVEGVEKKGMFTGDKTDRTLSDLIPGSDVDIWCELTHTNLEDAFPAIDYIRWALQSGKHIVTTNKGPASLFYDELKTLADKNNVCFQIEGTVMAGTPVINLLTGPLAGCKISKVRGILNGTTNYILTKMTKGTDYKEALCTAQELGYAEADPRGDVEGFDAMAKVKILAGIIFNKKLEDHEIYRQGIRDISGADIKKAKNSGKCWKLIGSIEAVNGNVKAYVRPEMIDLSNPLAGVNENLNALTFTTDLLGDITIIGPGAGKKETGFAVLNELIRIT